MRHKVRTDRLGRFSSYRKATIKSIVIAVLLHQSITTTKAKAKSARMAVEKIITLGKKGTLSAKRRAFSLLCDHKLVKLLFDTIAPNFANRVGGYTRLMLYRRQRGDNAELAILELTEKYEVKKFQKVAKEEKVEKQQPEKEQQEEPIKEERPIKETKSEAKEEKELPKEKPVKKEVKQEKEQEKKPHSHPAEEDKQKQPEEKKPRGFLKGFKGLFKKERDSL